MADRRDRIWAGRDDVALADSHAGDNLDWQPSNSDAARLARGLFVHECAVVAHCRSLLPFVQLAEQEERARNIQNELEKVGEELKTKLDAAIENHIRSRTAAF